jgi:outer membrane receptor protein involved in Fe transport
LSLPKYDARLGELTLTPRISFKYNRPWHNTDDDAIEPYIYYDMAADRLRGSLTASYQVRKGLSVLAGAEAYQDRSRVRDFARAQMLGGPVFAGDVEKVSYSNLAGFAQLLWDHSLVNLTAGARAENHSEYGSSFVPRLAATRVVGDVHVKLLASRAFRAPGIENINGAQVFGLTIEPETTQVFEVETGYRLSDHFAILLNAFDITIDRPIVYFYDEDADLEGYRNFDQTGTRGGEAELHARYPWGYVNTAYSFYQPGGKNEVADYAVPGVADALLAFPTHKLTVHASYQARGGLVLSGWAVILGSRYAYTSVDASGDAVVEKLDPRALFGAYASYGGLVDGLDIGLGGFFHLPGQRFVYIQPYNSLHAPLPGTSTEIMIRLTYAYGL